MSFGKALELLKQGKKLARKGWNGKGMFVIYQNKEYSNGIKCNPYLQIKCVNNTYSMWVPSINDLFAEDWEEIDVAI